MRKTIITILFCGVMILGIAGCGHKNKFDINSKSDIQISEQDVSLTIKKGTLKNTCATLVLTNKSDKYYYYGNPYDIEIKKDGEWHKINVETSFTLPAFGLSSGESKEIELNWENEYGKLAKGTYRIIKEIDYEYDEGNHQTFKVAVEFKIN